MNIDDRDSGRRRYTMTARADAAAATGERIKDAALRSFSETPFNEVTLASVAERAGVTVQTVIRRFGSKEGLFEAVAAREFKRVRHERMVEGSNRVGLASAVHVLVAHYEKDGAMMLRLLAQEARSRALAKLLSEGRMLHEEWVRTNCAEVLVGGESETLAAAIAATDLYVWKLLRLDRGMSREDVERTMLTLLEGLADSDRRD